MQKSCRTKECLKNSKISLKFVKDSCRRQNRLKILGNRSNLSKIVSDNKEFVKFFQSLKDSQIFSSAGANFVKFGKDRVKHARNSHYGHKIRPVNRSKAGNQFRRDAESAEKAKAFQPSDLARRPDSR
jgi:hypothetical protein